MSKSNTFILTGLLLYFSTGINAQNNTKQVGIKLINEMTDARYSPGLGAQFILPLRKKSSLETGLYYQITNLWQYNFTSTTRPRPLAIREKNILVPVLYRFDSRPLNFTIGPVMECFLSWQQTGGTSYYMLTEYKQDNFELLSTASISRNFMLCKDWIFEPELRFTANVIRGGYGLGLNLSLRKKLF